MKSAIGTFLAAVALAAGAAGSPRVEARTVAIAPAPPERAVDLVIALDVSGSMTGLIESAKQRLWDVVNELGRAQPQPRLRVAILSYGTPSYGAQSGYVRIDQPFTTDLDSVNETLFAFTTSGGDEYVARAVKTSVDQLKWSTEPGALKIIFVAGNEAATQDPEITVEAATGAAVTAGIVVNTIYCGNPGDEIAPGWATVARATNGMYASIDQNAAAVANVATPMDEPLARLNAELNATYVAYGANGRLKRENQVAQDANAAAMSAPAAASRAVTKAGALYDSADWDLVDAVAKGKKLEEVPEAELPAEMRAMNEGERQQYVAEQAEKRADLKARIAELAKERRDYIAEQQKQQAGDDAMGLDQAIKEGLRKVAEAKGFAFKE